MKELTYVNPYTWESERAKGRKNKGLYRGRTIMDRTIDKFNKREPVVDFVYFAYYLFFTYISSVWYRDHHSTDTCGTCFLFFGQLIRFGKRKPHTVKQNFDVPADFLIEMFPSSPLRSNHSAPYMRLVMVACAVSVKKLFRVCLQASSRSLCLMVVYIYVILYILK